MSICATKYSVQLFANQKATYFKNAHLSAYMHIRDLPIQNQRFSLILVVDADSQHSGKDAGELNFIQLKYPSEPATTEHEKRYLGLTETEKRLSSPFWRVRTDLQGAFNTYCRGFQRAPAL